MKNPIWMAGLISLVLHSFVFLKFSPEEKSSGELTFQKHKVSIKSAGQVNSAEKSPGLLPKESTSSEAHQSIVKDNEESELLQQKAPQYPGIAIEKEWEGTVMLALTVAPEGHVTEVKLVQSSGFIILDEAAKTAARQWKFSPGQQSFTTTKNIIFELND